MTKIPNDDPELQEIFSHIEHILNLKNDTKPSIKQAISNKFNPITSLLKSISKEKQHLSTSSEHTDENTSIIPLTNQTTTEISTMKHQNISWTDDSATERPQSSRYPAWKEHLRTYRRKSILHMRKMLSKHIK